MNQQVTLFTPEGDMVRYRRLSARLPEFLAAYPPHDGYQVEVRYLDPVEVKPGLKRLYEAALAAGRAPAEAGLPSLTATTVIFRAELLNAKGQTLATASALRPIQNYKDWEKGETAARQRLLAALGFGGEAFDEDEVGDQADQGLRPDPPADRAAPEPPPARTPPGEIGRAEKIPQSILRQIHHQARIRGVDCPAVATLEEAKATLKSLLQG